MTSPTTTTRRRAARPKLDAIAADAVDLAREALEDVTEPGQVGQHLRAEASADRLVTHVFECTMPGYRGWSWVAVLARAPRAKFATVAETALLPGDDALLAPDWEPWSERLKPEDIGAEDQVAQWELGLGRPRVLSPEGRADAAERWIEGDFGPRPSSGRGRRGTVSAHCSSCGFLSLLAGSLRGEFGVCTNEWSPADGRVVHLGYGCGAHSETGKEDAAAEAPRNGGVIVDELDVEYQKPADGTDTSGSATDRAASDKGPSDGADPGNAGTSGPGADSCDNAAQGPDPQGPDSAAQGPGPDAPGPDAQGVQSSDPAPEKESADAATGSDVRVVGPADSADTPGDTDTRTADPAEAEPAEPAEPAEDEPAESAEAENAGRAPAEKAERAPAQAAPAAPAEPGADGPAESAEAENAGRTPAEKAERAPAEDSEPADAERAREAEQTSTSED